jgi:pyridoxal phosphate enzyme (YggS family)
MSLTDIQTRLETAARRHNRVADDIHLIAVSKVQPLDRVEAVLGEGQRVFGENRVQEAQGKWPSFQDQFDDIELHLIGPLQSNKTRAAMELFDVIHTVDRSRLAQAMARVADETGACPEIFVQVNTGDETQKAGCSLQETDALIAECRALGLPLKGLMCIPPVHETPSLHFALLAKIAAQNGLDGLSMGMSSDFEDAIAQGATHIRVGSAIFGDRAYA